MVGNWIYDDNLRLFMELLVDAAFDDDDWVGSEYARLLSLEQWTGSGVLSGPSAKHEFS